jgi:DNA ligase (NAD+)
VGEGASKELAAAFKSMDAIKCATVEDFVAIEGFGTQMGESLFNYFANQDNVAMIERMRIAGVVMESTSIQTSTVFEGMTFVITGTLSRNREDFKKMILSAGGKVSDSVSKRTSYLLAGENAGSKLAKAEKLGITILDETSFTKMLSNTGENE